MYDRSLAYGYERDGDLTARAATITVPGDSAACATARQFLLDVGSFKTWDAAVGATCSDIARMVCPKCDLYVHPSTTRTGLCTPANGYPTDPCPQSTDTACEAARSVMANMDGVWRNRSCEQIKQHVCCESTGCGLFVGNNSIRTGLCNGSSACPAPGCSNPPPPTCTCPAGTKQAGQPCPGGSASGCTRIGDAPGDNTGMLVAVMAGAAALGLVVVLAGRPKKKLIAVL